MKIIKIGVVPSLIEKCYMCHSLLSVSKIDIKKGEYKYSNLWPYIGSYTYSYECPICKTINYISKNKVTYLDNKKIKTKIRSIKY